MVNQYTAIKVPPRADILNLIEKNQMSQKEIGNLYGVSQKVVWRWCRVLDIHKKPIKRNQFGPNNSSWKPTLPPSQRDKNWYRTLHKRAELIRGKPKKCEICGTTDPSKKYHWASPEHKYDSIYEFIRMCVSCHCKHDFRIMNILKGKGDNNSIL